MRLVVLDMAGTAVADGGLVTPLPGAREAIEEGSARSAHMVIDGVRISHS